MQIKTSSGDFIEVENNEYLFFKYNNEDYKVLLRKINTIGDHLLEDPKKYINLRLVSLIGLVVFLLLGVKLIFDPYISWEGRSYEEVNRFPDLFVWILFAFSLFSFIAFNNIIKKIKSIDLDRNEYSLPITVIINDDPKKKELSHYIICRGSIDELKEIKSNLEMLKSKALLV